MKIALVNMNQLDSIRSTNTIPILQGYIASYLNKHKHDTLIIDDLKDAPLTLEGLNMYMQKFKPALVGFSGYQYLMERIRFFARFIKEYYPETKLLLGGPQALFLSTNGLADLQDFDIICNRGEGELTTLEIANALENGESFHNIAGIIFNDGNQIVTTKQPEHLPQNLDIYSSPYIDKIINLNMKKTACIFTSRGCENVCNFCVTPLFNKNKIRLHSIDHVLEEMLYLETVGMESVWIGDPNFTAYKERTVSLMEQKIKRGIKIPFWCQTRVDMVDRELLILMQKAGLHCIGFGLESGSDSILNTMHKEVSVAKFHEIVSYSQSIGIRVELFSMYGQPGETCNDARKTISIVQKYGIPIYANSCAQQLQLTHGSVYGMNPEKFGFKIINKYIPGYLSVWHEYETDYLKQYDIKKIQAVWVLYNAETDFNINNYINVFHTIDFIMEHKEMLNKEKRLYEYWIRMGSLLEDREIVMQCIKAFSENISNDKKELIKLLRHAEMYSESEAVQNNSRVIVFCQYKGNYISEKHFLKPGINDLRHKFQKKVLNGMKINESKEIMLDDGAGTRVTITILRIYNKIKIKKVEQFSERYLCHNYSFISFSAFENSNNELLLFLWLKGINYSQLAKTPHVLLNMVSFYSKMHKFEEIEKCFLAALKIHQQDHTIAENFGDIIAYAGKYEEAIKYYNKSSKSEHVLIKKAYSYVNLKKYKKAYCLIKDMDKDNDLLFNKVMLECLQNLYADKTDEIRALSHRVVNMEVQQVIENSNFAGNLKSKVTL